MAEGASYGLKKLGSPAQLVVCVYIHVELYEHVYVHMYMYIRHIHAPYQYM